MIKFLADDLIWLILLTPLALWLMGDSRTAIRSALSGLAAWAVTWGIKSLFYFPRPYIISGLTPTIGFLLDGSFPSGHTSLALGVAFAVFPHYRRLALVLILASALVGAARVASGVHSPLDLLGSVLVAGICTRMIPKLALTNYHSQV